MSIKTYADVFREDAPEIFLRFAEASGTTAADETRFGRDFTHAGSPTLDQSGLVSKAVSYDGTDDETTYSVNMPITGYPFTVEGILQAPGTVSTSTEYCRMDVGDASADTDGAYIALFADGSDNLNVRVECENGGTEDTQDYRVPNALKGNQIHVVVQYVSATERNVYANGVLIGTATTNISFPANLDKFAIGNVARSTGDFVSGVVAEPAWYNYQLPEERIRIHHAVARGYTDTDSYGYAVMTSGPVAWLRLQESSGTDAADASGNKRDFTHSGSPTLDQTGPLASGTTKAVKTDGSDDEITYTTDSPITAYPFTLMAWFKPLASPTSGVYQGHVAISGSDPDLDKFSCSLKDDSGTLRWYGIFEESNTYDDFSGDLPSTVLGTWVHCAVRYVSSTERYFYVNGETVGRDTATQSFISSPADIRIQNIDTTSVIFAEGSVAEPALFARDLAGSEIRNIYAKGKQYLESEHRTKTLAKCPSAYYRLGESSGTTASDETAFGRDGTYAGTGPTLGATGALTGDADTAVEFNGTDDQMTYTESFITQYPVTLEALVKLPATPSASTDYIRVGITDASGTHKMIGGLKTDSNTKLQAVAEEIGTATGTINNSCGGAVGNYHHLIVEFISDTSRKAWLNGVELEEETTSVSITFANLDTICVGVEDLGTDAWYAGFADEVVIYQRQLATDEKRDQYLSSLGYHGKANLGSDDSGLIQQILEDAPSLIWPHNETSGTDADDPSRWGRDGTYSGGFTLDKSGPHANYKSVGYDGTDGEAEYSDANDIPVSGYPMVIASVLKSPSTLANSTDYAFFGIADSGGTNDELGVMLRTDGSGNIFARGNIRVGGTDDHLDQNSGTGLSAQNNKFLHVVLVMRSATDRELYVNGRSVAGGSGLTSRSFPSTLDTVAAGKLTTSSASFYAGDQMMGVFFDYELTESQIRKHSMAIRGVLEADNPYLYEVGQLAPAVHYRFNEASGAPSDLLGLRDLALADAPTQSNSSGPIYNVNDDGSIQFDGSNDDASVADDAQVTDFPIAVYGWCRTPSGPGTNAVFSQGGMGDDGTGDNGAQVALETDGSSNVTPSALFKTAATTDNIQPASPVLEADVWHFLMFVLRSSTERELYANGAPLSTETTARAFPSNMDDIVFGRDFAASPTFRAGYFAEGGVLTTDISDSEALDLYQAAFKARGIVPLGEQSVVGDFGVLMELFSTKELSFATLGSGGDAGFQVRVEIDGSITKDFRNVQTFSGAIGVIADLDGVVSATITKSRQGQIDVVAEFSSPATFEQIKSGQIDAIVEVAGSKSEGETPVTDQDIGSPIVVRVPNIDYVARYKRPPGGRNL